jgi:hypothetical protein
LGYLEIFHVQNIKMVGGVEVKEMHGVKTFGKLESFFKFFQKSHHLEKENFDVLD